MDILDTVDRCIQIELGAAEIYERLAGRFTDDADFRRFWDAMADDEREHAHKLSTWRSLLALSPAERRLEAEGFEEGLGESEKLVARARVRAEQARTPDDAFAIALALELSELDVIYTVLLQSSPIARFPDIEQTRRREIGRHHEALVREVEARSRNEKNRFDAALIAARE